MDTCSSCGHEVLPDEDFCTNCGSSYNRATKTSFSNPAVEAAATQLDAAVQQPQAARVPPSGPPMPAPAPRTYSKPLTIGGWSPFDKVRLRWGGGGCIVLGIALIASGHSAGATVFGLLFIGLGIATWIITQFGTRGQAEFNGEWHSAWNSMSTGGRAIAGTGAVIGLVFVYLLFFWFFIIIWVIKILT
jgi:zinc-ribbon domain